MRRRSLVLIASVLALILPIGLSGTATSSEPLHKGFFPIGHGMYAKELKTKTPDWYTPELHRRVVAAGKRGESVPLPDNAEIPQSALLFSGIRPGSWMLSPSGCTLNFVFGGRDSIGTAGHCASNGDEVTIVALPGVLMNIGKTVKSVDGGIGNDFALIDVYPAMEQYVRPSMAIIAGPTGTKAPAFGDPILHVGHGLVIGTGGTARAGLVTYPSTSFLTDSAKKRPRKPKGGGGQQGGGGAAAGGDGDYAWIGAVSFGDSGSGARAVSGEAVGDVTHLVVDSKYLPAWNAGTTISRMLEIAGQPLSTASLVPDPLVR
jgi:hypothetical protein